MKKIIFIIISLFSTLSYSKESPYTFYYSEKGADCCGYTIAIMKDGSELKYTNMTQGDGSSYLWKDKLIVGTFASDNIVKYYHFETRIKEVKNEFLPNSRHSIKMLDNLVNNPD